MPLKGPTAVVGSVGAGVGTRGWSRSTCASDMVSLAGTRRGRESSTARQILETFEASMWARIYIYAGVSCVGDNCSGEPLLVRVSQETTCYSSPSARLIVLHISLESGRIPGSAMYQHLKPVTRQQTHRVMGAVGGAFGPCGCPVQGPSPIDSVINSARAVGKNRKSAGHYNQRQR